uniref:Diacylglycerol kinase n=1 Tax=Oncorhynchus kisutch TaxID=8019 RepID=A0A8C7DA26_ONCKI
MAAGAPTRTKNENSIMESASPLSGRKKAQQSPGSRSRYHVSAPGHCFRKVTLTKPTFCHNCSDFIWGLIGFICEVCNFMCHEKCLKTVRTACSCMAPTLVRVSDSTKLNCSIAACDCVCELHAHSECAAFSCGDCRLCHQDGSQDFDTLHHHWREGNIPSGARCEVCRRTCGSSDVLAGMRCEWCGMTTHAACYVIVPPECGLGRLRSMLLHPACVQICSRNFSKMHCYRISESCQNDLAASCCGDVFFAAGTGRISVFLQTSGKQVLKVFDGDDAVKRSHFRLVSIPRITKNEEVVESALRTFYIPDDSLDYELQDNGQQALHSNDILNRNGTPDEKAIFKENVPEAWLLRAKPQDTEVLKVYAGWLKVGVAYISISISKNSTVDSVIKEVLTQLGRQVQFTSRQMNQTRFYIVESRKQVVQVNLLLEGLPVQLSKEEYTNLLQEHLAIKSAVVVQITCFSEAERIYMLAKDTSVSNQQLTSLVIPEIMHNKLPKGGSPLLVFVNPKSGGLKGQELLYGFRKLLNPHQVFDMTNGGPLPGLHTFREVPRFRVLVCGGDGTVGWVLGVLEAIRHKLVCPEPPIGIVPLGTGNDLARILRWGAGYSGEDPHHILVSVDEAEEVQMDRWTILLDAQEVTEDGKENGFLEPPKIVQMNNYFGLGIDAELSLDFHHAREEEPGKFNSRFHNKGVYLKAGLQKLSHTRNLHKDLKLQVDKQEVELPSIEGLIFLNIPSWGSGADLWGSEGDSRYGKPRIDDGMLEVVGVTGVVHMGQVQGGMRSGIRLAQGNYVRITVTKPIPVQVDGEPWIQAPGNIIISAAGPKVRMLRKSKHKQKKQPASLKERRSESPSSSDGGH